MKRIFLLAMSLILLCSFPVRAAAEEAGIYENAGALYEAWVSGDCVPDYITAVISTDGGTDNLTFGLVAGDAGERGRQEILDLVRNDASVTIMYQTYSRNELDGILDEIVSEYFAQDLGLVTAGVYEGANKIILEVKTDYVENPDTLQMIRDVTDRYGDRVSFSFTDSEIVPVVNTQTMVTNPIMVIADHKSSFNLLGFSLILCSMMLAVLCYLEIRRHRLIAATGNGAVVIQESKPLSRKEVEDAIRSTEVKPSEALQGHVMRSIHCAENENS